MRLAMPYLRIVCSRIVAVIGIRRDEGMQIRATDPETRVSILADIAACVINTKDPTVQSTEVGYFEVRIAFLESHAPTNFTF